MLEKFESISNILSIVNDENKSILYHATKSPMNLLLLHGLTNEDEKIQYFIDNIDNGNIETCSSLFSWIEDHSNNHELMSKLLWTTTTSMNDTFLMIATKHCVENTYLFNWIIPFIKKLNNTDRLKLLSTTNNIGNTVLHFAANQSKSHFKYMQTIWMDHATWVKGGDNQYNPKRSIRFINIILSLFPTKKSKQEIILHKNNFGYTAFMTAFKNYYDSADYDWSWKMHIPIAHIMWNNINDAKTKLKLVNINCSSFDIISLSKDLQNNWKQWVQIALHNMKDKYINSNQIE
eukprot:393345_1